MLQVIVQDLIVDKYKYRAKVVEGQLNFSNEIVTIVLASKMHIIIIMLMKL